MQCDHTDNTTVQYEPLHGLCAPPTPLWMGFGLVWVLLTLCSINLRSGVIHLLPAI